jgi:signal peptidase I
VPTNVLHTLAQASETGSFREVVDSLARTPLSKVVFFVVLCTVLRLAVSPYLFRTQPHQRTAAWNLARWFNEVLDALVYAGVVVFLVVRPFGIQAFSIPSGSMEDTLLINDFIVANKAIFRYSPPKHGEIVVFRPPAHACASNQIDSDGQPKVDFIKRCIGTPGDVIEIRSGTLYRNGKPVQEPFRKGSNEFDWKLVFYDGPYEPWKGKYIPVILGLEGMANYNVPIAEAFAVGSISANAPRPPTEPPAVREFKQFHDLSKEERERIDYLATAPAAKIPARHFLMMGDNRPGSFDGRAWGLVPEQDVIGRSEFIWWPPSRWHSTR